MKNLLLLTFVLAICYFEAVSSACTCVKTRDCSMAEDGDVFADPSDCGKYFVCYAGRAILNTCPSGFLFESTMQVCNPSRYVNCGPRPMAATTTSKPVTTTKATTQTPCTTPCPSTQPPCTPPTCTTPKTPCTTPCQTKPPCTTPKTCSTTPCQTEPPCTTPKTCSTTPCQTKPPCPSDCESTTSKTTTSKTTTATTTVSPERRFYVNRKSCNGVSDGTLLAHRTNVYTYFECLAGRAIRKRCKSGEFFNLSKGLCESAI